MLPIAATPPSLRGISDRSLAWSDPVDGAIEQVFGVDSGTIRSQTRGRAPAALARQVAMYTAHVACGFTLTDVGRLFDRDRTTVAHACGAVEDRRDDPIFDRTMELVELIALALATPSAHHGISNI